MRADSADRQRGAVVLAAYRPPRSLFLAQLRSIRDQTRRDYICLVGADGGRDAVRRLVSEAVGDDPRFTVVGWDERVGFYLNFERLLQSVPVDVGWVALSDHDDVWRHDKLERLVPLLDDAVLATGQARVVRYPEGDTVACRTHRRCVPPRDLLFENQVSGALSIFRRELLDVALPFPRLDTVTQLHDHWLAICAVATDRYAVLDEVVQDYVQHDGNLIGEIATQATRLSPTSITRRMCELAERYEGGHSPAQVLRACHALSFGWRRLMLATIEERVPSLQPDVLELWRALHDRAPRWRVVATLIATSRSGATRLATVATFIPGLSVELARPRRRYRRAPRSAAPCEASGSNLPSTARNYAEHPKHPDNSESTA